MAGSGEILFVSCGGIRDGTGEFSQSDLSTSNIVAIRQRQNSAQEVKQQQVIVGAVKCRCLLEHLLVLALEATFDDVDKRSEDMSDNVRRIIR